jgi:hypothetical protein
VLFSAGSGASGDPSAPAGFRVPQVIRQVVRRMRQVFRLGDEGGAHPVPVQRLATIAHGDGICTTHVTSRELTEKPEKNDKQDSGGTSA